LASDIQSVALAISIGISLMLILTYALKRKPRSLLANWAIGFSMIAFAAALLYPLIGDKSEVLLHPVRFGLSIVFWGVGINQLARAARIAYGHKA
jgi:4-hydroxybenzoate polyprenyltransferase